jgi:RNA polymerase sigma-70 factor (ECF subfamily)
MDREQTDEQVMHRLGRGDDSALADLMHRWGGSVGRFLRRMLRDADLADDVHQETWVRIYRYRERYDPDRCFRSYLFGIAVNCARTAIRRKRRLVWRVVSAEPSDPSDRPRQPAIDPPGDPAEGLLRKEQHQALLGAVDRLPDAQRAVVLLYLCLSTNYDAIAEVLGKRPASVRADMHRAVKKLRRHLSAASRQPIHEVCHE